MKLGPVVVSVTARRVLSESARAMRDGMLWMVPYLMVWSTVQIAQVVLNELGSWNNMRSTLLLVARELEVALPIAIAGSISAMSAIQWHLPRTPVAFGCASGAMVLSRLMLSHGQVQFLLVPMAIVVPLIAVPCIAWLSRRAWTRLVPRSAPGGSNVVDTLNLTLPTLLTFAALILCIEAAAGLLSGTELPAAGALLASHSPLAGGIVYAVANSALWSVGVHGYYALLPLLDAIDQARLIAGGPVDRSFLGLYVFIGGSGATLSLAIAALVVARSQTVRLIALASIVPALINVNELLLFGLPLIWNARLFLPFVLAPLCNLLVAYSAVGAGWVAPVVTSVPFNSPVGINALLATGGDPAAVCLQVVNVLIGTAIYAPFVIAWERQNRPQARPAVRSIDTFYNRQQEQAALVLDDPVSQLRSATVSQRDLAERLRELGHSEFVLHYQPVVDPGSGRVVGAEALLRLDQGDGQLVMPEEFLPTLEAAGLMKDIDHWVLGSAVEQLAVWRKAGTEWFEIGVNISPQSLTDPQAVQELVALVAKQPGHLVLEITERSLMGDEHNVHAALAALRAAGCRVLIDDFGTGYSSLSYLHTFDVDGIKIDRRFTDRLSDARGRQVFAALCSLARRLNLAVVVEGVERNWQLRHFPRGMRAHAQGWLFARAMPAEQFVPFAQSYRLAPDSAPGKPTDPELSLPA